MYQRFKLKLSRFVIRGRRSGGLTFKSASYQLNSIQQDDEAINA
jgi:hypothetical protein